MTKTTEYDMIGLLFQRYDALSQGVSIRYAYASHVRSHAGFDAKRTADFMAMDLWPSSGLPLHGHEVKVSRSDWLCELRDPSKAEEFKRYMNYWWLVIADRSMVKPGELPEGWGMMAPDATGALRVVRPAPKLAPLPLPRTMLAALLRAVQKTAQRQQEKAVVA